MRWWQMLAPPHVLLRRWCWQRPDAGRGPPHRTPCIGSSSKNTKLVCTYINQRCAPYSTVAAVRAARQFAPNASSAARAGCAARAHNMPFHVHQKRQKRQQRCHLPDALRCASPLLTDREGGLITDATSSPFTKTILSYMCMQHPDTKIK